jgi:hypothetical protein
MPPLWPRKRPSQIKMRSVAMCHKPTYRCRVRDIERSRSGESCRCRRRWRDERRSYGIGEHEFVELATKHASEQHPELRPDAAFSKLYESEESVRRACSIAKAAEFSVFDIKPVVVGGPGAVADAINDTENSAVLWAHEEIVRIGREKFPFLSADQQFARVFEDSKYAALAAQAHRRPGPTTVYAAPHPTPGNAAYAKADPAPSADGAYAALLAKAKEHQAAHPELTEAQAFERIYTDRSNIELAKRERGESGPG